MVDLKRAQTRIAYDQLIQHFMMEPLGSQQLLFPVEREISISEAAFLNEQEKNIARLGFQWRIENDLIYISGAPAMLETEQVLQYFDDILSTFLLRDIDVGEIVHTLVLSLAKTTAYHTKKNMSQEELNHVVQELFSCAEHSFDPSGNKILKLVDLKELTHDF